MKDFENMTREEQRRAGERCSGMNRGDSEFEFDQWWKDKFGEDECDVIAWLFDNEPPAVSLHPSEDGQLRLGVYLPVFGWVAWTCTLRSELEDQIDSVTNNKGGKIYSKEGKDHIRKIIDGLRESADWLEAELLTRAGD